MMNYPKKFMRNDLFKNVIQTQIVREDGIKKTSVVFQGQEGLGTPEFKGKSIQKLDQKKKQRTVYTESENNRVRFQPDSVSAETSFKHTPVRVYDDEIIGPNQGRSIMPFAKLMGRPLRSQAGPRTVNVRQA